MTVGESMRGIGPLRHSECPPGVIKTGDLHYGLLLAKAHFWIQHKYEPGKAGGAAFKVSLYLYDRFARLYLTEADHLPKDLTPPRARVIGKDADDYTYLQDQEKCRRFVKNIVEKLSIEEPLPSRIVDDLIKKVAKAQIVPPKENPSIDLSRAKIFLSALFVNCKEIS